MESKDQEVSDILDRGANFLEHFGIKGMHWGVRRSRGPSGRVSGPSRPHNPSLSEDARKAKESHAIVKTHGSTDPLSNKDLQHLVSRLNLEQQFYRLTQPAGRSKAKTAASVAQNGKKTLKEALGLAMMAKQTHELANSQMVKDVKKAFAAHQTKKVIGGNKHFLGG